MGNSLVETPFGIFPTVTPQWTPFDGADVIRSDHHLGTSFLFELCFIVYSLPFSCGPATGTVPTVKDICTRLHLPQSLVVCGRCIAQFFTSQRLVQDFAHAPRGM